MKQILLHFRRLNWVLITTALLLVAIGLVSLYSSSIGKGDFWNFKKQIIFLAVGVFLMLAISFFDWRIFQENSYLILALYFLLILALLGLFLFAPEIKGAKRWYRLGGLTFDPLEIGKIILIILLAKYFSMRHVEMYNLKHIILSGIYIFIPSIIVFFQPDMGSAIILILLWIGILFISGIKLRHFLILVLCGILVFVFTWSFFLRDYQKSRIISFFAPEIDPLGASWSQTQAKIAIGQGGFLGQGIGKGSQTQYGFLSEPHTDFIFAAIGEEMGFAGIALLFFLFIVLIREIIKVIFTSRFNFPRLFAAGFALVLIAQFFVNTGMNLGIFPVVGIPLPFVSYGGSSLISMFIGLGISEDLMRLEILLFS